MRLDDLCREVSLQMRPVRGQGVLIALSGGADSVALAYALCRVRAREGWRLWAAHVNHGMRGAESDGDQAFVEELCRRLGLQLVSRRLIPPEQAGETWAREARYAALREMAAQAECGVIALAHHQDDQAETLLEHLLRGTGPEGLAGMRPLSRLGGVTLARPLLGLSRAALREALAEAGESWREDSTNAQAQCLRNRLRLEILPALEALSPGASARMASAARLQAQEQSMLEEAEQRFLQRQDKGWRALPLTALEQLHPAMQARVLRRWWRNLTQDAVRLDERQCRSSRRTASCVRFRHQRRSTRACMAGCSCSSAVSGKARHPLSCRCKKRCSASSSMDCSCACNRAADAIRADAPGDSASRAGRISSRRRLRRHCACALVLSSRQLSPASARASRSAARDNPSNGRASVTPPRRLRGRMPASPSGPVPRSRCSSRVSA